MCEEASGLEGSQYLMLQIIYDLMCEEASGLEGRQYLMLQIIYHLMCEKCLKTPFLRTPDSKPDYQEIDS
jgi:hypothetical protein